ncbi:hypothetical protein BDN67DRAFT_976250, partial [Paxillus ammoniavirescens]
MYQQTHLGHPRHPPTPRHDLPTSQTRHVVVDDSRHDLQESADHERAEYTHHIIRSYRQPTQLNQMRRKQYGATGGVSQSQQTRGRRAPRLAHRHRTPSTPPIPPITISG